MTTDGPPTRQNTARGISSFGPYTSEWGGFLVSAAFALELDNVDADNGQVVTIDINDATTDEIIATRTSAGANSINLSSSKPSQSRLIYATVQAISSKQGSTGMTFRM